MTLLVRDEEDILGTHLEFHFAQGVDHVIVTDNLSIDRTSQILASYQAKGKVSVVRETRDDYSQGEWVTRMARSAYEDHRADWVINSDADEFWWPLEGTLKSTLAGLPQEVGVVTVPRTDFLPTPDDGRPFHERMVIRERTSRNDLGDPLPPKVCHRGRSDITVAQGNHAIKSPALEVFEGAAPLTILHFPLRCFSQFENKIKKGGRAYERNENLPYRIGRTWRNLYRLHQAGALRDYYRSRERSGRQIADGLRSGALVRDDRLSRYLQSLSRRHQRRRQLETSGSPRRRANAEKRPTSCGA